MVSSQDVIAYGEVASALLAVFAVLAAVYRFRKRLSVWLSKRLNAHEYPGKKDVQQHQSIYNALVELRALCDADRAYVIRFHNGHEFLLSDPIWKCTCTHEVVRPGVTYESMNIQGLLVSRISELVQPIISGDYPVGASKPQECANCQHKQECMRVKKHLTVFQVEEMEQGYTKFFLQNQNIKTLIMCGLTSRHGPFGVVGIDITSNQVSDTVLVDELASEVCSAAERIQFLFLKKDSNHL